MGIIFDTTILISAERRRGTVREILAHAAAAEGNQDSGISTVSVVELTHGIHRARNEGDRRRRFEFREDVVNGIPVYPLTTEIAQLAGQIEGEQAALGIGIPFEDLIIGATALHLGFAVATANTRHFQLIPGLRLVAL